MSTNTERLIIERDRNQVILTLTLTDDYAAIKAYEDLIWQAREGFVLLDVETVTTPESEVP